MALLSFGTRFDRFLFIITSSFVICSNVRSAGLAEFLRITHAFDLGSAQFEIWGLTLRCSTGRRAEQISQSANQLITQSRGRSTNKPASQPAIQPVSKSNLEEKGRAEKLVDGLFDWEATSHLVSRAADNSQQTVDQHTNQPDNQPTCQPASQPNSQPAN